MGPVLHVIRQLDDSYITLILRQIGILARHRCHAAPRFAFCRRAAQCAMLDRERRPARLPTDGDPAVLGARKFGCPCKDRDDLVR